MRVKQSVEMLSETTRQAILDEHRRRFPSFDTEANLPDRLCDHPFLASMWDELSELERKVIGLFVRASARGFFSRRQWEQLASRERHLSVGMTKLRRLGIVFTVRKLWSEIGYVMPTEVRNAFTLILLKNWRCDTDGAQTLPYYIPAGRGLHLDVFSLLLHLREHEVPLTQRRRIHRRVLQRMCPLVSLKEEHVRGMDLLNQDEMEALPLYLVLDVAMLLGLVQPDEKRLRLNHAGVREWLQQSPSVRWEQLFRLVTERFLPHEPWIDALTVMMRHAPTDRWCSLGAMLEALSAAGFALPEQARQEAVRNWLHLLLGFGWIQLGQGNGEQLYWRWNGLQRLDREEGWFVDPSGAVTIPPLTPLDAVWKLGEFCSLHATGELMRGELQAKQVQAYLANGGTEQQVLATLAEHCVHPLPEAVSELIRLWGKSAMQIRMEPVIRVQTATPMLLDELRQIPSLEPYLQEVVSPTAFLIPLSREREFASLLSKYGYEPLRAVEAADREGTGNSGREAPDESGKSAIGGLFSIERPWDGYAVENTFPDQLDGLPQLATLPKIWTSHLQSYHPQTMRDLLKRAQDLQMEVQVELADGTEWLGVPQKVEVEMGFWYVTLEADRKKHCCRLEEIKRARIVIPEYLL